MQIFNNWCDTLKHHWIKFSRNIHGKEFLNCILEKVAGVRKDNGAAFSIPHSISIELNWQTTSLDTFKSCFSEKQFQIALKVQTKLLFSRLPKKSWILGSYCKLHHKIMCWPRKLPYAPDISLRRKLHQSVSFLLRNEWNRKSRKTI